MTARRLVDARRLARVAAILSLGALGGCGLGSGVHRQFTGFWLLHPAGPVAGAGLHTWIIDTATTFLVIGPTTLLVMWCIWRYRVRAKGRYTPGFSHSIPIELVFWGFPLAIVAFTGFVASYIGSFQTDPGGPGAMAHAVSAEAEKNPINVDVITTDWQWLFVYPDKHIAAANELVVPVNTPIRFRLTSSTVVTDFYIPQLVGEIDIMPGMRTLQGLIADRIGTYDGFAADYNGPGFAWMDFRTRVVSRDAFDQWEAKTAQSPVHLDQAEFQRFATPTINKNGTVTYFSAVEDHLFSHVIQQVMAGETYPTPPNMTEKKAHETNGGKQENRASQTGPSSMTKS